MSLTISQDPVESAKIQAHKDDAHEAQSAGPAAYYGEAEKAARKKGADTAISGTYVFRFPSILDTAASCRILENCRGLSSALYFVKDTGFYYLVLSRDPDAGEEYDGSVLRINDFADMVSCSDTTLAYIREHSDCILRRRAVQQIAELYS